MAKKKIFFTKNICTRVCFTIPANAFLIHVEVRFIRYFTFN